MWEAQREEVRSREEERGRERKREEKRGRERKREIVLIAESETDLQALMNLVNVWCSKWRLDVNLLKTNVMHVRKQQCMR